MNRTVELSIKALRKIYSSALQKNVKSGRNMMLSSNREYSNVLIKKTLLEDKPCMIARLGSTELACMINYLGVNDSKNNLFKFINGSMPAFWWENNLLNQIERWSGFFPSTEANVSRFCELMIKDIKEIDILGSWLYEERYFDEQLINAKKVLLEDLEPFFCEKPWTRALSNKRVLVVHPFEDTIQAQYEKKDLLFDNTILPEFTLLTVKAVQSVAYEKTKYNDWFEALEDMKNQIDRLDYDICLIGCGAYGLPLAAHVKRMGKKAVHLGGATQLLFGIKGKRWENHPIWPYRNLFNEYWVRPGMGEKPKNATIVEGATYW